MLRFLSTLLICFSIATTGLAQSLFFPSGAPTPESDKEYQKAIYALMNLEHRKFYIKIENFLSQNPTFMALAHRAMHDFHINGVRGDFEKNAKKALSFGPEGEVEKAYAKVLKMKLKNPKADVSPILKKLASKTKTIEAYFLLGNYYLEVDNLKKAHITFYRAYRANKEYSPLLTLLSKTSLELGYIDTAEELLTTYMEKHPRKANAHDSMGDLLRKKKDFEGAIEHYEKAFKISRNYKFSKEKADKLKEQLALK